MCWLNWDISLKSGWERFPSSLPAKLLGRVAYTQSVCLPSHRSWLLPPPLDRNCSKVTNALLMAKFSSFSVLSAMTSAVLCAMPLPPLLDLIRVEILPSTSTPAGHNIWHLPGARPLFAESVASIYTSVILSMSSHITEHVFSDMKERQIMWGPLFFPFSLSALRVLRGLKLPPLQLSVRSRCVLFTARQTFGLLLFGFRA